MLTERSLADVRHRRAWPARLRGYRKSSDRNAEQTRIPGHERAVRVKEPQRQGVLDFHDAWRQVERQRRPAQLGQKDGADFGPVDFDADMLQPMAGIAPAPPS
jgi:hypothetical protein